MRISHRILAFAGVLLFVPALALASVPAGQAKPKTAAKTAAKAATHSTNGIIQSVTDTSLVIAKTAKATKTETFVLNASTVKKGDLAIGARVGVRYMSEGGQNVATAVTATKAKGKTFSKSSR